MKSYLFIIVFTFGSYCTFAQDKIFSGKVIDTSGNAISKVSVMVVGENKAACITNDAGEFTIKVPAHAKTILFSAIGCLPCKIAVEIKWNKTITLYPMTKILDEVLVIAYGRQRQRDVTGAVSLLESKDLKNIPVLTIDQALQGKVAGVNITQSGTPGASPNINIRGVNSISSNSQPLIVVDGVPISTPNASPGFVGGQDINFLGSINPSDIASFVVLKDAGATALYGARAANGVILITTKRGRLQKTQIDFSANYGIQKVIKKLPSLNSQEYVKLIQDEVNTFGIPRPSMIGLTGLDNDPKTYTSTTDWQDKIFQTAPIQNYNLALSGGNEKTKFRISGKYTDQKVVLVATGYKQYGFRVNLDNNITSKLSISTDISANYTNYKRVNSNLQTGPLKYALFISPIVNAYNADGSYGTDPNGIFGLIFNPLLEAYEPLNTSTNTDMMSTVTVGYSFSPSLSFKSVMGANYINTGSNQFFPSTTFSGSFFNGAAVINGLERFNLSSDNTLKFSKGFNHQIIDIIAGYSINRYNSNSYHVRNTNFPDNNFTSVSAGLKKNSTSERRKTGNMGTFARVNYTLYDKYEIAASIRRDGSSVFGVDKRWGNFPSISLGWKLSEENFLKNNTVINFLKIRGSYGITGNQDFLDLANASKNLYGTINGTGNTIGYINSPGIGLNQLGNPDVGWEESEQTNLGVDAQFLQGKIGITADYFIRSNRNALLASPLAGSTGFTSVYNNIGSLQNKGLELTIQTTNISHKNFQWASSFNITFAKNKVTKLNLPPFRGDVIGVLIDNDPSWVQEGYALGSFRGYKVKRIFQSAAEIAAAPFQSPGTKPGDIQFADINNDGVIDSKDQTILGKAVPDFSGGFTNRLTYKNLEATIVLNYLYGNSLYNSTRRYTESMDGFSNQTAGVKNRWSPKNTNTTVPRAALADPNKNNRVSDRWIEDGSYARLKTITLTYNFNQSVLKKLKLNTASFFVSAENVFLWTKYTGYDPEVNSWNSLQNTVQGFDQYNSPLPRTIRIGINLSFL